MTISDVLGLSEKSTESEVETVRDIPELLKQSTFQDMNDSEIYALIDHLAEEKANVVLAEKLAESEDYKVNIRKSILYKRTAESLARFERLEKKHLHYAITGDMGEIVGYTDDTEEEE